jgi:hypothetical protein
MREAFLAGLIFIVTLTYVSADTISNPTVDGQVVDDCTAINGATDCQRAMTAATAVCKEYGFRRADSYHLHQIPMEGVQLRLSIDGQETVYHTEWRFEKSGFSFDTIECSK